MAGPKGKLASWPKDPLLDAGVLPNAVLLEPNGAAGAAPLVTKGDLDSLLPKGVVV